MLEAPAFVGAGPDGKSFIVEDAKDLRGALEQREDKSAALRSGHGVDPKGSRVAVTAD
jgi:hypothetical protein